MQESSTETRETNLPARCLLSVLCCVLLLNYTEGGDATVPVPRKRLSFQQGVDGYAGTVDTEIWALATTTILESNPNASSDANNDGGESQVLLRFDEIIGAKPRQIPRQST